MLHSTQLNKKIIAISLMLMLPFVLTACTKRDTNSDRPTSSGVTPKVSRYDTVFPLPADVQNFTGEGGENPANFQTSLALDKALEFYKDTFIKQGLTERTLLTVTDEKVFSIVFDGSANGKALVVQGTSLTKDKTNVNIRYEAL